MPAQSNSAANSGNQLQQAEACATLAKELINQAVKESISNQAVAKEAIKQAAAEIAQCQTMLSQAQSSMQSASQ